MLQQLRYTCAFLNSRQKFTVIDGVRVDRQNVGTYVNYNVNSERICLFAVSNCTVNIMVLQESITVFSYDSPNIAHKSAR